MRYFLFYILLVFTLSTSAQEYTKDDSCCISIFHNHDFKEIEITKLSKEFKRLSALKNLCCDPWNSDLHLIMLRMGEYYGEKGTQIKDIINEMGMPDGTEKELALAAIELNDDEKALVYLWRSYHDFLYFVYENDTVIYSEWFMWGE